MQDYFSEITDFIKKGGGRTDHYCKYKTAAIPEHNKDSSAISV